MDIFSLGAVQPLTSYHCVKWVFLGLWLEFSYLLKKLGDILSTLVVPLLCYWIRNSNGSLKTWGPIFEKSYEELLKVLDLWKT